MRYVRLQVANTGAVSVDHWLMYADSERTSNDGEDRGMSLDEEIPA